MTDQNSTDPVDVAKAMLQMAGALDSRTPRPDPFTLTAWSSAIRQSPLPDITVREIVSAVTAWSLIADPPAVRPGAFVEQVRLARARRRPPTIAEQDELEARRIARIDAIASVPRAIEVASEDRSDVSGAPGAVSGPAAGTSQSPLDHRERPNLAKSLDAVGRSL
jgi:hypothetical protein